MKTLSALGLGMLLASSAFAQPPQKPNEVFLGIGDPGLIWGVHEVASDVADNLFLGDNVTYGDQQGGFQVALGYQRWLSGWSSVGITAGWAGSSKTTFINGVDHGKDDIQVLTLMGEWRAHWLRRSAMDLYSGLGAGVHQASHKFLTAPTGGDEELTVPAFQLMPFGIRAGRDWGGFFEILIGTNGLLKAGLSRRL